MKTDSLLSFGLGNAKLPKHIATFSLPAGHTCPGALQCMARADRSSGTLTDGAQARFRCFAANDERTYPNVRESRWRNFDLLKGKSQQEMSALILASLPLNKAVTTVRIHVSGDFFSATYFLAWCDAAAARPDLTFYAYTKSIHLWRKHMAQIPPNMKLTASEGGRFDTQIGDLKRATVVFSDEEAEALGLAVDHDDTHAYEGLKSFALRLHGPQAKGSVAAYALSAMRAQGIKGYSRK